MKTQELFKGTGEMIILASLADGPKHGYAINEWIRRVSDGALSFSAGTLYPLLHTMEKKKLLSAVWRPGACGPPRKEYTITKRGKRVLATSRQEWKQFVTLIQGITY